MFELVSPSYLPAPVKVVATFVPKEQRSPTFQPLRVTSDMTVRVQLLLSGGAAQEEQEDETAEKAERERVQALQEHEEKKVMKAMKQKEQEDEKAKKAERERVQALQEHEEKEVMKAMKQKEQDDEKAKRERVQAKDVKDATQNETWKANVIVPKIDWGDGGNGGQRIDFKYAGNGSWVRESPRPEQEDQVVQLEQKKDDGDDGWWWNPDKWSWDCGKNNWKDQPGGWDRKTKSAGNTEVQQSYQQNPYANWESRANKWSDWK